MSSPEPKVPIDFSNAKEPPTSLDVDKQADVGDVIEPEEVSKDAAKLNLDPDEISRQEDSTELGTQVIRANLSAG